MRCADAVLGADLDDLGSDVDPEATMVMQHMMLRGMRIQAGVPLDQLGGPVDELEDRSRSAIIEGKGDTPSLVDRRG